ncbi:MAG: hypothetical protein MJ252_07595 [archaeon]|nr:hypothetical protein [archaeon]
MEQTERKYFQKLGANPISYLLQFFTPEEMVYLSQLDKKFKRAFSMDFLWKQLALKEVLFLPEESDSFTSWKKYVLFLKDLTKGLSEGKYKTKYKHYPYRGHKAVISHCVSVQLSNGPYSFIISADETGKVFTWDLDEDGDYAPNEAIDLKTKINEMKYFEDVGLLMLIGDDNKFTFMTVDNYHYAESKVSNDDRLEMYRQFNFSRPSDMKMKDFFIDSGSDQIYMCSKFLDKNVFSLDHSVYRVQMADGTLLKEYTLRNDNATDTMIRDEGPIDRPQFQPFLFDNRRNTQSITPAPNSNSFCIDGGSIIVATSYDATRYNITNKYRNAKNIPNVFLFSRENSYIKSKIHVDMDYIFNVFKGPSDQVILTGTFNNSIKVVYLSVSSLKIEIKQNIQKDSFDNINELDMVIASRDKSNLIFLVNCENLFKVDLKTKNFEGPIALEKREGEQTHERNCYIMDPYRVIIANSNNHLKIHSSNTGKLFHYLSGGSTTVVPKSFIKHPNFNGFHIIIATRYSIIGVMGNLIREYCFTPNK